MAAKKINDYTLEELLHIYKATKIFLDESAYAVREIENPLPSEKARFNFYNRLYAKVKEIIEDKLKAINEEISK